MRRDFSAADCEDFFEALNAWDSAATREFLPKVDASRAVCPGPEESDSRIRRPEQAMEEAIHRTGRVAIAARRSMPRSSACRTDSSPPMAVSTTRGKAVSDARRAHRAT